jgi:hypothetical protein
MIDDHRHPDDCDQGQAGRGADDCDERCVRGVEQGALLEKILA